MVGNFEEIRILLSPYSIAISDCFQSSCKDYNSIDPDMILSFEKRTRANIIRDRIVFHLKKKFHSNQNIRFIEDTGLFLLEIEGKVRIRFNKLNEDFTLSSDHTKRTKLFLNQDELFPEYQYDVINLVAGYKVNSLWEVSSFYLTCPNGSVISWVLDLDSYHNQTNISIICDAPPINSERVKIKPDITKKAANYGKNV